MVNAKEVYKDYYSDSSNIEVGVSINGFLPKDDSGAHERYLSTIDLAWGLKPEEIQNQNILEIGCGVGGVIQFLQKSNKVFGLDASESGVKEACNKGINVRIVDVNNSELPFEENYFDSVIALEIFEHFTDPQFVLDEIKRVLKPEGLFIVSTPNPKIQHIPRLYYPNLFTYESFNDFLSINDFQITDTSFSFLINFGMEFGPEPKTEYEKFWIWTRKCRNIKGIDALAHNAIGNQFLRKFFLIEAMEEFKKAADIDYNFVTAFYNLSTTQQIYAQLYSGNKTFLKKSWDNLNKALKLDPASKEILERKELFINYFPDVVNS